MPYELKCRPEKIDEIYDVKEQLGKGQFAVVRQCCHKETGIEGAAKFIKIRRTRAGRNGLTRELVAREASILSSLDHEKIIKLYDIFDNGSEVVLVLEYLGGGELFEQIIAFDYVSELDASVYTKQVLSAIDYIHDMNIVHLDIKPENIVLTSISHSHVKVVDFGLAQKLDDKIDLKQMQGTPEFVGPEVINFEPIGLYTDIWAIGVLAFIMISGNSPFLGDNQQETYANITKAEYEFDDQTFGRICEDAKDFISKLLVKSPRKRLTAKQCLEHPWIKTEITPVRKRNSVFVPTEPHRDFLARQRLQSNDKVIEQVANGDTGDIESLNTNDPTKSHNIQRISLRRSQVLLEPIIDQTDSIDEQEILEDPENNTNTREEADILGTGIADKPETVCEPEKLNESGTLEEQEILNAVKTEVRPESVDDVEAAEFEDFVTPAAENTFSMECLKQPLLDNVREISAAFHSIPYRQEKSDMTDTENLALVDNDSLNDFPEERNQFYEIENELLLDQTQNKELDFTENKRANNHISIVHTLSNALHGRPISKYDNLSDTDSLTYMNPDSEKIVNTEGLTLEICHEKEKKNDAKSNGTISRYQDEINVNSIVHHTTNDISRKKKNEKSNRSTFDSIRNFVRKFCCFC